MDRPMEPPAFCLRPYFYLPTLVCQIPRKATKTHGGREKANHESHVAQAFSKSTRQAWEFPGKYRASTRQAQPITFNLLLVTLLLIEMVRRRRHFFSCFIRPLALQWAHKPTGGNTMNKAATIYSIITTIGAIAAIIAGAIWIIAAIRHRPATIAKIVCIGGVLAFTVGLVLFVRAYDPALAHSKAETTTMPQSTETKTEAPTSTPTEAPVEPAESQEPTEELQQEAECLLTTFSVKTCPVMNGTKTEQIGTWAYIEVSKETMRKVTDQQLKDYIADMDGKGYNWFNIFFEDGTGLYCMTGLDGSYVEYGKIEKEEGGCVLEGDRQIYLFEDGAYR